MTREEAITYIEDIKNGLHETGKDFPYRDEVIPVAKEALDIAIKALEQEPILDKIRAEIEQERVGYPPSADYYKAIMKCLQIIDKCKAEKE